LKAFNGDLSVDNKMRKQELGVWHLLPISAKAVVYWRIKREVKVEPYYPVLACAREVGGIGEIIELNG